MSWPGIEPMSWIRRANSCRDRDSLWTWCIVLSTQDTAWHTSKKTHRLHGWHIQYGKQESRPAKTNIATLQCYERNRTCYMASSSSSGGHLQPHINAALKLVLLESLFDFWQFARGDQCLHWPAHYLFMALLQFCTSCKFIFQSKPRGLLCK